MFSPQDKYVVVNYHYVEDPDSEFSSTHPCSVHDFKKQVKFLSENFKIVPVKSVFEAAKARESGEFCAFTFDDGLRGQYENAIPILEKYGAFGLFFPITSTWEGKIPAAHKTHILLSKTTADDLVDLFHRFIKENYSGLTEQFFIPKDRRLTARRMYEAIIVANLKETLIALPEKIRSEFLNECFKNLRLNEKELSVKIFMSREQVADLTKLGMMVGNHSHRHYPCDSTDDKILREDIRLANNNLIETTGIAPEIFSYPSGRNSEAVIRVLKEEGFRYALTIERRQVEPGDDPFLIPRYDTTDIKLAE